MTGITDEMVERAVRAMQNTELDYPSILTTPDGRKLARAALLAALGESHVVVPKAYDMRALAKYLYEHCALTPEKAGSVSATLLAGFYICPADTSPDRGGAPSPELPIISD